MLQGVAFIAVGLIVLLISIGSCTLPLQAANIPAGQYTGHIDLNLLNLQTSIIISSLPFSDDTECSAFASVLNAVAAFVIISAIATGATLVVIAIRLLKIVESRIVSLIAVLVSVVCCSIAFGLMIHAATGVFCGNYEMNSFLHVSGGFACMLTAMVIAVATFVIMLRSDTPAYGLPTGVLSFVLCIGSCLIPTISGSTTVSGQPMQMDVGLLKVTQYQIVATVKLEDYDCATTKQVFSAVAAFIILSTIAAGFMIVVEIISKLKSIDSRVPAAATAAATSVFAFIACALQIYGFVASFCDEGASSETTHLAGAFVCTVLVGIISAVSAVMTLRTKPSNSFQYVSAE